jgi:hypothetical protein
MDTNMPVYGWAEQMNREQLSNRAARAWLAEAAAGQHATFATRLGRATGRLLVRAGERLKGLPNPAAVPPIAVPSATRS